MYELTEEQKSALDRFEKTTKTDSISQNALASMIGTSGGAISAIKNGKYEADPSKILQMVMDYFKNKDAASVIYKKISYAPTEISQKIYKAITGCHIQGDFCVVSGSAGIGKTKTAMKYVQDNPNNALYITLDPCVKNNGALLRLLADTLNISIEGKKHRVDQLKNVVRNKLHDGMVLIVDEAQNLVYDTMETLRSLADFFILKDQTFGIVLMGNQGIYEMIDTEKYDQVSNRAEIRLKVRTVDIKRDDIKLLFPIIAENEMIVDLLHQISITKEGLRGVSKLFSNAYYNDNYTYDGIISAAVDMHMEIKGYSPQKSSRKAGAA